jgi:predicted nucleic acid-binding protein
LIYFDTAYLAKCYLNEPGSEVVRSFAAESSEVIVSSVFARAELAAVFHCQLRESQLSDEEYAIVFAQYEADLDAGIWEWLDLPLHLWANLGRRFKSLGPDVFLRGADAVHLETAIEYGLNEVFTNDRHMLAACSAFGLTGRNLI